MPTWPLHEDLRDAILTLDPLLESYPKVIHEEGRTHVIEWRPEHFKEPLSPEDIEHRIRQQEDNLGDVLHKAETFDWGRAWLVDAAPE